MLFFLGGCYLLVGLWRIVRVILRRSLESGINAQFFMVWDSSSPLVKLLILAYQAVFWPIGLAYGLWLHRRELKEAVELTVRRWFMPSRPRNIVGEAGLGSTDFVVRQRIELHFPRPEAAADLPASPDAGAGFTAGSLGFTSLGFSG